MYVYLDNNATTPIDPRVLDAMMPYQRERFGNASSLHRLGRQARAAIDEAREKVAGLVNAHPSQVVFTSGGTEANNLALKGAVSGMGIRRLGFSAVEHSSVRDVAKSLTFLNVDAQQIPASQNGMVDVVSVKSVIENSSAQLLSVIWVNNETGVINDIPKIAEISRARGVLLHTDAVQAVGKVKVDFLASGVHMLSLSAHKIYGPKGVGALIVDKTIDLQPLLNGGGQEQARRGGTEDVAAIVGFGAAAELAAREFELRNEKVEVLRTLFEAKLKRTIDGVEIFGEKVPRVANTVFMGLAGFDAQTLTLKLDEAGFAIGTGAACSSKTGKPSAVLTAMQIEESLARSAIRISLGHHNTEQELEQFVDVLFQQIELLREVPRGI